MKMFNATRIEGAQGICQEHTPHPLPAKSARQAAKTQRR
jgi:hypothetical protein